MRPEATIVSEGAIGSTSEHLAALLSHLGVRVRRASLSGISALPVARAEGASPLVALNAREAALALIDDATGELADSLRGLIGGVLLFDTPPSEEMDRLLRLLTGGAVAGVRSIDGTSRVYDVAAARSEMTGSLQGVRLGLVAGRSHEFAIDCAGDASRVETICTANGEPFFAEVRREGDGRLYLLATDDVLDLDEPTDRLDDTAGFSAFVPVLMLLRGLFGEHVWHASAPYATLVVDDPLLTPSYGYLHYERLLADMDRRGYATEVAFIPLNRRRTRGRTARLFQERSDRLTVCVHGCDHTRAEFGATDPRRLRSVVAASRARMEDHRLRAGLDYDDVMVFPQGIFSTEAMHALGAAGFTAAVNSGPKAFNDTRELTNRDFLCPAVRRYGGLPLFVRRALEDPGLMTDPFLGRPALIVCHPADFGEGRGEIARVVDELNARGVRWAKLGEVARELSVQRRISADRVHVRALSPRIVLRNDSGRTQTYLVAKAEPERVVTAVRSSGGFVRFRRLGKGVFFELEIPPGQEEVVELVFAPEPAAEDLRHTPAERARILLRRRLAEVRDVWLVRNGSLLGLARRLTGRA